jgi:hypothetical protein
MERAIGYLGQEVRQPSNPFANLSRKAIQLCQVNALKAIIPKLDRYAPAEVPQTAIDIGNGFVLLRARDRTARAMLDYEKEALRNVGICPDTALTYPKIPIPMVIVLLCHYYLSFLFTVT